MWWKPWTWVKHVVSYETVRESEWDNEQYQLMYAFEQYEGTLHACGHPIDETTSFDADPNNPDGKYFYKAQLPIRCHACTALELAQAPYKGEHYDSSRQWVVDKVMRPTA